MLFYIYVRVSTLEQVQHGHSLDAQVAACLAYAKRNNLTLGTATNCGTPGVFVDAGRSGYKRLLVQRPGGLALLSVLKPHCGVICTTLSRLFRRLRDAVTSIEEWGNRQISVHCLDYNIRTDTPNGKLIMHMIAAVAQWRSEINAARVRESREFSEGKEVLPAADPIRMIVPAATIGKDVSGARLAAWAEPMRETPFTGRVRAYVRVSTKAQSVDAQVEQLRRYIENTPELRSAEVVWYTDHGHSAFRKRLAKRPAGSRLMADLSPGDMVLVLRPDRAFRSIHDMANQVKVIEERKAFLCLAENGVRSDSPSGRMIFSLLSMVAEMESREISKSIRLGSMAAISKNPMACPMSLPSLLRAPNRGPKCKRFKFDGFFSQNDRYLMFVQWWSCVKNKTYGETGKHIAARVTGNLWLRKQGFPALPASGSCMVKAYLKQLTRMQQEESSPAREKLIQHLKTLPKDQSVISPIGDEQLTKRFDAIDRFLTTLKALPQQTINRQGIAAASQFHQDPVAAGTLLASLQ